MIVNSDFASKTTAGFSKKIGKSTHFKQFGLKDPTWIYKLAFLWCNKGLWCLLSLFSNKTLFHLVFASLRMKQICCKYSDTCAVFWRSLCPCSIINQSELLELLWLTVVVGLVRVRHQPAVVWPRWHSVGDPVVVVVIVALVSLPVFVRVQLRAVDYERAIILGVLMAVTVAAGCREEERDTFNQAWKRVKYRGRKCQ